MAYTNQTLDKLYNELEKLSNILNTEKISEIRAIVDEAYQEAEEAETDLLDTQQLVTNLEGELRDKEECDCKTIKDMDIEDIVSHILTEHNYYQGNKSRLFGDVCQPPTLEQEMKNAILANLNRNSTLADLEFLENQAKMMCGIAQRAYISY